MLTTEKPLLLIDRRTLALPETGYTNWDVLDHQKVHSDRNHSNEHSANPLFCPQESKNKAAQYEVPHNTRRRPHDIASGASGPSGLSNTIDLGSTKSAPKTAATIAATVSAPK